MRLCGCGCGNSFTERVYRRGKEKITKRFIRNHHQKLIPGGIILKWLNRPASPPTPPPSHLCECGCGRLCKKAGSRFYSHHQWRRHLTLPSGRLLASLLDDEQPLFSTIRKSTLPRSPFNVPLATGPVITCQCGCGRDVRNVREAHIGYLKEHVPHRPLYDKRTPNNEELVALHTLNYLSSGWRFNALERRVGKCVPDFITDDTSIAVDYFGSAFHVQGEIQPRLEWFARHGVRLLIILKCNLAIDQHPLLNSYLEKLTG